VSEQEPRAAGLARPTPPLPYQIADQDGVEIARALSAPLAFAMFRSATSEHPDRSLLLRHHGALIIERFV
jgi:hypothetical protein